MKTVLYIFISALICGSCSSKPEKRSSSIQSSNNKDFTRYLKEFKNESLPITIKGCEMNFNNDLDSSFLKFTHHEKYPIDQLLVYRKIPTNGNYFATITLRATDCNLPVITTYTSSGKIIDEKTIAIGLCGSDCGFVCTEFMTIKEDFTIYVSDTIRTSKCDESAHIVPGTEENYVIYQTGKLLPSGKIQLSKEQKKVL